MKEKNTIIYTNDEVSKVAQQLIVLRQTCAIFTLTGSLGAGKTTLVREMLRLCGVEGSITSPTFTYVNLYANKQEQTFYHFDCYRITELDQFIQAGFDEYLYLPDSWCFIEWPEMIMPLLTNKACHISIDYHGIDKRELSYKIS